MPVSNDEEMTHKEYLEELDERQIDNVETAALARQDAAELIRTGNRVKDRAEKLLRAHAAGPYGDVELDFQVDPNREYPDMDQIRADYAQWGKQVPTNPGKPGIVINFKLGAGPRRQCRCRGPLRPRVSEGRT